MGNKCGAHTVPYIKNKIHLQQLNMRLQRQKSMKTNYFTVTKEAWIKKRQSV